MSFVYFEKFDASIILGMGIGSAAGPPMALRNAVPQERSSFDKVTQLVAYCIRITC